MNALIYLLFCQQGGNRVVIRSKFACFHFSETYRTETSNIKIHKMMKLKQLEFGEYAAPECVESHIFLGGGILSASDFGVTSENFETGSTEDDNWE
jgi:hypothetical protein